jgi:hypothetical protein
LTAKGVSASDKKLSSVGFNRDGKRKIKKKAVFIIMILKIRPRLF